MVRMRIRFEREDHVLQRPPCQVKFIDPKTQQQRVFEVRDFSYAADCLLDVSFHVPSDAVDGMNQVRSPTVCFADGSALQGAVNPVQINYTRMFEGVASIRDELERVFPGCQQTKVGLVDKEIVLLVRLTDRCTVALCSDRRVPMFTWDEACLIPYKRSSAARGPGFRLLLPEDGQMRVFWYGRSNHTTTFQSVDEVVRFAGAAVFSRPFWTSEAIMLGSDVIRTRVKHLGMVFSEMKVATFSGSESSVKVYLDLQWTCEVHLNTDGSWRVQCNNPDPIVSSVDAEYQSRMACEAEAALEMSAHFFDTGRVCANCSLTVGEKMRRCPCKAKVYYCGKECQRAHWAFHRPACDARK